MYEAENTSGGGLFDHHHCTAPAVYNACGNGLKLLSGAQAFRKEYGLTEQIDLFSGNSLQVFNRLTSRAQQDIREEIEASPDLYEDKAYLDQVNTQLKEHYAYLIVRKGNGIIYWGRGITELYTVGGSCAASFWSLMR